MPKPATKKKSSKRKKAVAANPPLDPMRTGMPAQDSIVSVREMKRGGKVFRIMKTDEVDEYDPPTTRSRKARR